jgi:2-polyprenyl-3-methyl-5-hydroxy-6-metoxy-1,4-benzoquinol methylase
MNHNLTDKQVYLERMSKPLQEKLRVGRYIDASARKILDVGCADGTITLSLAHMFPDKEFLGIDLDAEFVALANKRAKDEGLKNVRFENVYLRDLLARPDRYDTVLFVSVLHEFFSYGQGISSVLKAVADSEEMLNPGGDIVIRDMILHKYTKHTSYSVDDVLKKIRSRGLSQQIKDFEKYFGEIKHIAPLNHFLLKYMYKENWDREAAEDYVPVTFEQYENIFSLLGMELVLKDSQLVPYLKNKWAEDFGLTEDELALFRSTGFLVAKKLNKK